MSYTRMKFSHIKSWQLIFCPNNSVKMASFLSNSKSYPYIEFYPKYMKLLGSVVYQMVDMCSCDGSSHDPELVVLSLSQSCFQPFNDQKAENLFWSFPLYL